MFLRKAGKIVVGIILNYMNKYVINSLYPEYQCKFQIGRSTADINFHLRQVQENQC